MGRNSLDKAKRHELEIAKILSKWVGIELVRTPMSGAWEGCEADIWPKDPKQYFPLVVECKHQESWSIDQIMKGTGLIFDWLSQAEEQCKLVANRDLEHVYYPVLIFKKNYFPNLIAISYGLEQVVPIWAERLDWFLLLRNVYVICDFEELVKKVAYIDIVP